MRRKRWNTTIVSVLLAAALGVCSGCDLPPPHLVTFGAGFLLGRASATQFAVVTTERVCYQNGVPIECP